MGLKQQAVTQDVYKKFDKLDGSHPLKSVVPNGFVDYPVRIRSGGKVSFFNFALAKEMGLISKDHPNELTEELTKKIYETFSIQIINEYDQMKGTKYPVESMKSGTYMATRYLQLQHGDKQGRTSGDGRSVWNGQVKNRGKTWDISSGGTGATCLSPATSKYNKFFETGDPTISYGCGYAEVDEGMATTILSSIFQKNRISTERSLAIIEYKNNISINVRAHENLLRPSHFFLYLKQNDLDGLKALTDYYIENQVLTSNWKDCPAGSKKYDYFLDQICSTFAKMSATFEDEYIFCWMDWDGDNILMDGGVVDYGSIRQFGLFHHEYRYDDVERFSTTILEQKVKTKYMIQSFAQMIDYIKSGKKKNLACFLNSKTLNDFDNYFELHKNSNLLFKIGFTEKQTKQLLKRNLKDVEDFRKVFSYFEKCKSEKGMVKTSDGITWDAIYNMRNGLRELPQLMIAKEEKLNSEAFLDVIKSEFTVGNDLKANKYKRQRVDEFQSLYRVLVLKCANIFQTDYHKLLLSISTRSQLINKPDRVTGDSVTIIVDQLLKRRKKINPTELYQLVEDLASVQCLNPDQKKSFSQKSPTRLLKSFIEIIKENREGI